MNPLISVIVPIYNSEKFLKRCLDSIINQTYNNIEILLINDGSKDNSQSICQEYENNYKNVRLYNKENGGLGSARNCGLDNCKGDFISFVDSDDWLDLDYIENLFLMCTYNNAQVATISLDITREYRTSLSKELGRINHIYKNEEILYHYFKDSINDSNLFSVCTTLFQRDLIIEERFREGKLNEDMDFKYRVLKKAKTWVTSKENKYHYFQGGDSLSSGIVKKADFDLLEASSILMDYAIDTKNENIIHYAKVGTVKPYFSLLTRLSAYGCVDALDEKEIEKKCIAILRGNFLLLLNSPMKVSRKAIIIAFMINFNFTKRVIRLIIKNRNV